MFELIKVCNAFQLVCIEEGDKDARELVLASILQTNRLTSMISHTLNVDKNAPPGKLKSIRKYLCKNSK